MLDSLLDEVLETDELVLDEVLETLLTDELVEELVELLEDDEVELLD